MTGRRIVFILLAAALAGVAALCGLTAYGSYRWAQANNLRLQLLNYEDTSAEAVETRSFQVSQPVTLEVDTSLGDISVTTGQSSQVAVEIIKTAWGKDTAAAQVKAEAVPVEAQQEGSRLKLVYLEQEAAELVLMGRTHPSRVSFNIKVPAQTAVTLKTGSGDIHLSGTTGVADLDSRFGQVTVTGLEGSLTIQGASTGLTVKDVEAGEGDILLETSFGGILAEDLSGMEIQLRTASGEITAQGLEAAGLLVVENQFSPVSLKNVHAGALKAANQSGAVQIQEGEIDGEMGVVCSFGDLTVEGVRAASYSLKTSNGRLRLEGARGRLDLTNQFGDIEVTRAEGALLNLKSENGNASFEGSLALEGPHKIETSFGDILLAIPTSSRLDINLGTSFGEIESELPVMLSGKVSETHWKGSLNGGGAQLTAATENGSIAIRALENNQ